jgi:hypothetical protein
MSVVQEAPRPSLNSVIRSPKGPSHSVENLRRQDGVLLNLNSEHQDWWERVCKLQDADCSNKARDIAELRNSRADDKGKGPVNG